MYRKIVFILVLILFSLNAYSFSLNLSSSIYAQEGLFQGEISIDPGTYLLSEKVTLSTNGNSEQLSLQNLVDCSTVNCTNLVASYITSGATETQLSGSTILTGFKIRKNSVVEDAYFDISNDNSNFPNQPSIDIGNDNSPEWAYQGFSTSNFQPISLSQSSDFEETVVTENCQLFSLPKSLKYKINAYLKKPASAQTLDTYIHNINLQQDGSCQQPTASWGIIECNINLNAPLEKGDYYICLTGSNNVLAANSTSPDSKGYVGCSSGCKPVNKNYIINFSAAEFITTLDHVENFNVSNIKKDNFGFFKPLTDLINEYIGTCPLQGDYCIIPINISSNNDNPLRISNLNYKETTDIGEISIQHGFLSYIEKQSTSPQIIFNSLVKFKISDFNLHAPSQIKTYLLEAFLLSKNASQTYSVVQGPKARINISSLEAGISEIVRFDASESSSPNNTSLTYLWDFGDNVTSTTPSPTHSYLKAGTFVVILTVKDSNGISSTESKSITISGTAPIGGDLLAQIDEAEQYFNLASQKIKEVYNALGIDLEIKNAKAALISSTQLSDAQKNSISSKIPKSLTLQDSYEITPFLTTQDLNLLLPLQEESFKETAKLVNEKITQKIDAYKVSVTYISGQSEYFLLVKKSIDVPQTIQNPLIIDLLPFSLVSTPAAIKFIKPPTGEITRFESYQSIRISPPPLEVSRTNEIVYTISSQNIDDLKKIKTVVLPEDLNVALVPLNCGDNICNPGEDINICPEDCKCGNNICELDETELTCSQDCKKTPVVLYVSIMVILGGLGIFSFIIYKNPQLKESLRISELTSIFKSKKNLFFSESELQKLVNFIKASMLEGHVEKQIEISLLKKGWTKQQVDYAIREAKKKN